MVYADRREENCSCAQNLALYSYVMKTQHGVIKFLGGCGLLCIVLGLFTPSRLAAASPSDSSTLIAECKERAQQSQGADPADPLCTAQPTFRSQEELSNRSREEEQGRMHWRLQEPSEPDLKLWYYPGAPRPLWGY